MNCTIVLASSNQGKLKELQFALGGQFELRLQSQFAIEDAEETGLSFIENAILKARHASKAAGLPALGDDSGLCVDALNGAPGLYSARFAGQHGNSQANNVKLIEVMAGVTQRRCRFHCVLALVRHHDDPIPIIAEASWSGELLEAPRGVQGFGYDPLFWDPTLRASAAELGIAQKQAVSHRGQALALLSSKLREW